MPYTSKHVVSSSIIRIEEINAVSKFTFKVMLHKAVSTDRSGKTKDELLLSYSYCAKLLRNTVPITPVIEQYIVNDVISEKVVHP